MISKLNCDTDSAVELHRILTASLTRRFSMTETSAALLSDEIVLEIRKECGGSEIYIPGPSRIVRNTEIRQQFCGNNLDELATRHQLSRRQVERIIASNDTPPLKMSSVDQ